MAEVIKMSKLGLSMQKGTIVKWLFKEGERVEKGEPLLEIETEKIVNEVESHISEIFLKIYIHEVETVSILGMYGIEQFTLIINPPEAAILVVGAVKKVPIVIEEESKDKLEIRPVAKFTLSVDHRLIDGVIAAKFLNQLKYYLEFPETFIFEEDALNLKKK